MVDQAVPIEPEEFSAPLVQRLINTKYPDVVVESVRVVDSALASDDEQRVSTARRIAVEAEYAASGEGLPRRLMIKVARPGLGDIPLYDNEVNVYAKIGDELPVNSPRCLGAFRDRATSSFGLVLEDMRCRGVSFASVTTPIGAVGMKKLLDQLATLHAAYWQSPRFGTDLAWVLPHTSGPIHELFSHQAGVPMLIKWEVESHQFKRELVESIGETLDSLLRNVARAQEHQATLPLTLVHGDAHAGNTYVSPDGSMGLVDWQLTARGYCMHDVTYILLTGLSVDERRRHERGLIDYYRRRLVDEGVTDAPSLEELIFEHRLAAAWCLCIGWLTTPLENYGWEINVANHIRLATAYRDLDSKGAFSELS
jgi:thiamine kinase-like enzyme